MRKYLLFLFVLFSSTGFGQIVNIPDPAFKSLLIGQGVDANSNGEIEVPEALAVTALSISSSPVIQDTVFSLEGIRSFINVRGIYLANLSINELDLSGLGQLTGVQINNCLRISTLNFSGCDNLEEISLDYPVNVSVLDLNTIPSLRRFRYYGSSNATFQSIRTISATNHPNLAEADISMAQLEKVKLDHCDSLNSVILNVIEADSVSFGNCTNLQGVSLAGIVDVVSMQNCSRLERFMSGDAQFQVLNVANCTALTACTLMGATTRSIDLSSAINLQNLQLHYWNRSNSRGAYYLNLKNGGWTGLDVDGAGALPGDTLFVCADNFEVDSLPGISNFANLYIDSTCAFLPQGTINSIHGTVRFSQSGVACDTSSSGFPNVPIKVSRNGGDSLTRFTGPGGRFNHYDQAGTFTFTPQPPSPYFTFVPPSHTVTFDTANGLQRSVEFCMQAVAQVNDVEVVITTQNGANPGFPISQGLHFQNNGTRVSSGTITYQYDAALLSFLSTSVPPTSQSPGIITWAYSNLMPLESGHIAVLFELLPPPVNNIDDTLTFVAQITGSGTDETPLDNNFILQQEITGSYDPNDKTCLNGPTLMPDQLGENLYYLVRFQNLGTDTAINVSLVDILPGTLDRSSLQLLSSSHDYTASLKNNVLEYKFDNILLPPAIHNEAGSNGYVLFKIKPMQNLSVGNSIINKADIFFDFNPAVTTNDAITTVVNPVQPEAAIIEFSGLRSGEHNQLTYKVVFSEPAVQVILESSIDGMNYQQLSADWILHAHSGTEMNFVDEFTRLVKMHYRIRIISETGLVLKTADIVIDVPSPGISIMSIVRSGDDIQLQVNVDKGGVYETGIYSIDGKYVYKNRLSLEKGMNIFRVPFGKNAEGIYSFVVFKERKKYSRAFVWRKD